MIRHKLPYLPLNLLRNIFHTPLLQESALLHQQNLIRNIFYIGYYMGGQDNDSVFGKGTDNIPEPDTFPGIQACCGFIQDKDFRIIQHRLRDSQTAYHSS